MSRLGELKAALATRRFTFQELNDGSGVLIDVERMRVLSLNVTAMFALKTIAEDASEPQEVRERLAEQFEVDERQASQDLDALLSELESVLLGSATG